MKFFLLPLILLSFLHASIGTITAVQGKASLTRKGFEGSLKENGAIFNKDRIATKESALVQVILHDETIITIGPNSSYHFLSYNDTDKPEAQMSLDHGFFKVLTGKIGKIAPERFKIKTRAASIGVRGTQFMAKVTKEGEESIGCLRGTIVVETKKETYVVPSGKMLLYRKGVWSISKLNIKLFSPVLFAQNKATFPTVPHPQDAQNHLKTVSQEQVLNRRSPLTETPKEAEAFEITGSSDTLQNVSHNIEDELSIPIVVTPNAFEIRSNADSSITPPLFQPLDQLSIPMLLPPPEVFEVNSAFDNEVPPPLFHP